MYHEEIGGKFVDCIHLALRKDQWRAFAKAVMNIKVS